MNSNLQAKFIKIQILLIHHLYGLNLYLSPQTKLYGYPVRLQRSNKDNNEKYLTPSARRSVYNKRLKVAEILPFGEKHALLLSDVLSRCQPSRALSPSPLTYQFLTSPHTRVFICFMDERQNIEENNVEQFFFLTALSHQNHY